MEENFVALLLANSGLSALVANRIEWVLASQDIARPNIVLTRISGVNDYTYQGPDNLISSRVQIDCYALNYLAAKQVARAAISAISGFSGTQGSTFFNSIFIDSERDLFEDDPTISKLFRISVDAMIWHK